MAQQDKFQKDFEEQVNGIASYLEKVVSGEVDFVAEYGEDDYGEYDNYETPSGRLHKYFEDCLDVEFRVDSQLRYKGAIVALTLGGPNIYLDTCEGEIRGYWYGMKATADIWRASLGAIDDYWEQEYDCLRGC